MADSILIKKKYKAQAVLETSITFILAVIFILGIIRIGVWANAQLAGRQESFNNTRIKAGTVETEAADARASDKEKLKGEIHNLQDRLRDAINARRDSVSAEDAAALDAMSNDFDDLVTNYVDTDTYVSSGYVQDKADDIIVASKDIDLSGIDASNIESLSSNRDVSSGLKDKLTSVQNNINEFTDSYNGYKGRDSYVSDARITNGQSFPGNYVGGEHVDLGGAGSGTDRALNSIDGVLASADEEPGDGGESGEPEKIQDIIKELKSAISDYNQSRDDLQRQHGQLIWPVYKPKPLSEEWAIPKSPFKK